MVKAPSGRHGARAQGPGSRNGLIRTIAVFKLVKALLLVGVGSGLFEATQPYSSGNRRPLGLGPGLAFRSTSRFGCSRWRIQPQRFSTETDWDRCISLRRPVCRRRGRPVDDEALGGIPDDHCNDLVRPVRSIRADSARKLAAWRYAWDQPARGGLLGVEGKATCRLTCACSGLVRRLRLLARR